MQKFKKKTLHWIHLLMSKFNKRKQSDWLGMFVLCKPIEPTSQHCLYGKYSQLKFPCHLDQKACFASFLFDWFGFFAVCKGHTWWWSVYAWLCTQNYSWQCSLVIWGTRNCPKDEHMQDKCFDTVLFPSSKYTALLFSFSI